jgi:hypothetical protein
MRKEYDLRGGRPNPYARRFGTAAHGTILEQFLWSEHFVRLDDDLAATFPDDQTVNETLRLALKMYGVLAKSKRAASRPRTKPSA